MGLDIILVKATEESPTESAKWTRWLNTRLIGDREFVRACDEWSEYWHSGEYGDPDAYVRIVDHSAAIDWVKTSGRVPEVNQQIFIDAIERLRNDRSLWLYFSV